MVDEGVVVNFHATPTLAPLDEGEWSVSLFGYFTQWRKRNLSLPGIETRSLSLY
jgi:hypothetical protein